MDGSREGRKEGEGERGGMAMEREKGRGNDVEKREVGERDISGKIGGGKKCKRG